jgi:tRNA G18 (ribose-2'-O)-methylase SpoU
LWEYFENTVECVKKLKEEGYYSIALEQDKNSVDYKTVVVKGKTDIAFIIGGEVIGIMPEVLSYCDIIAEIPMLGTKESLNVTIAFGIAVYKILGI